MISGKGISTICSTIRSWMLGCRDIVGENAEETVLFSETHGVRGCVLERTKERGSQSPLWVRPAPHNEERTRGYTKTRVTSEHVHALRSAVRHCACSALYVRTYVCTTTTYTLCSTIRPRTCSCGVICSLRHHQASGSTAKIPHNRRHDDIHTLLHEPFLYVFMWSNPHHCRESLHNRRHDDIHT